MELDTVTIFISNTKGVQELTADEFIEKLSLGYYDGRTVEIIETKLK